MGIKKNFDPDEHLESMEGEETKKVVKKVKKPKEDTVDTADFDRLERVVKLVGHKFGINDEYTVKSFSDKNKQCSIALENPDFVVSVTIKNTEKFNV